VSRIEIKKAVDSQCATEKKERSNDGQQARGTRKDKRKDRATEKTGEGLGARKKDSVKGRATGNRTLG